MPHVSTPQDVSDNERGDAEQLPRMAVRVGELRLLFPWDSGREVLPAPPASRIPNTVSWLRGVANVRGTLVPVVDTAAALGAARTDSARAYLLICGEGDRILGLLIDGLPSVLDVGLSGRRTPPADMPEALTVSATAAYEHEGRVWLDVNLEILLEQFGRGVALS